VTRPPIDRPSTESQRQDFVHQLAAAPNFAASGQCFAAHEAGLSRSDDGGATWHSALDALGLTAPLPATCVACARGLNGEAVVLAGVPGGLLVSRDAGATWQTALLPSPAPYITAVAISPAFGGDGTAFAASMEDGVFVTRNGGASWVAWNIGLLDHGVLALGVSPAFARDQTLFAATESGIFVSANAGRFWRETAFPIDHAPVLSLALSPDFEHDQRIFGGAADGLFVSRDAGESWTHQDAPNGAINAILPHARDPAVPHLLLLADDTPFVSRDGGRSWSQLQASDVASICAPLGLESGQPLLLGHSDGRITRVPLG
jgi:photosystem II stability/assembly factor-like uncharacterized protein